MTLIWALVQKFYKLRLLAARPNWPLKSLNPLCQYSGFVGRVILPYLSLHWTAYWDTLASVSNINTKLQDAPHLPCSLHKALPSRWHFAGWYWQSLHPAALGYLAANGVRGRENLQSNSRVVSGGYLPST